MDQQSIQDPGEFSITLRWIGYCREVQAIVEGKVSIGKEEGRGKLMERLSKDLKATRQTMHEKRTDQVSILLMIYLEVCL